jgi:hypothetical protein
LVLRGVPDETLGIRKRHKRRRRAVPLVVGDDFNAVVLPVLMNNVIKKKSVSMRVYFSYNLRLFARKQRLKREREREREKKR